MQQVARYARNHECRKGLNNVPCVVWSCIKMHATHGIVNAWKVKWGSLRGLIVHQDARYARNCECPKGFNNVPCVGWSCIKMHATHEIVNAERVNNVPCVVWSCNKLHATYEIVNVRKGWIAFLAWFGRASRCTLRTKYQQVIGTRCEVCAIKCELLASLFAPIKQKCGGFSKCFNTSKIHRTFLFFF